MFGPTGSSIVARLASSLGVELVKAEALRSTRERPGDPDAADLAMQAEAHHVRASLAPPQAAGHTPSGAARHLPHPGEGQRPAAPIHPQGRGERTNSALKEDHAFGGSGQGRRS
jgi:hypothetical protein